MNDKFLDNESDLSGKIVAVDFDGTLCEEDFPNIGAPIYKTIEYVKSLKKRGAKLILWTCRYDSKAKEAEIWCEKEHNLKFDAINDNLPETLKLYSHNTRKVFAHKYIDDRSIHPDYIVQQNSKEQNGYKYIDSHKDKYIYNMTSMAFPEQYDIYYNGEQVAYFRLRHGYLRVTAPDFSGNIIYSANNDNDACGYANFNTLDQRCEYIKNISKKLNEYLTLDVHNIVILFQSDNLSLEAQGYYFNNISITI